MTTITGALTALVTPFRAGVVDEKALRALVAEQIEAGIHGLVPCGTTGESATLSAKEYELVVRTVVEEAAGRVPVVAGAGSASTAHALELARAAQQAGANGLLTVAPYYNRPSQAGLIAHFRAIADAVDLPIVLYNVPYRTGSDITLEVLQGVADHPRVVGIKEATNTVQRTVDILDRFGERFQVLSGDDVLALPIMAVGGVGVISVVANMMPAKVAQLSQHMLAGELVPARAIHKSLVPLIGAAFAENSPAPTKAALAMMGRMTAELRAPLAPISAENEACMRQALVGLGVL